MPNNHWNRGSRGRNEKANITRLRARKLPHEFTASLCASVIHVQHSTLNKWIKAGCPAARTEQGWMFDKLEFVRWLIETGRFDAKNYYFVFPDEIPDEGRHATLTRSGYSLE